MNQEYDPFKERSAFLEESNQKYKDPYLQNRKQSESFSGVLLYKKNHDEDDEQPDREENDYFPNYQTT